VNRYQPAKRLARLAVGIVVLGCAPVAPAASPTDTLTAPPSAGPVSSPEASVQDVLALPAFASLELGPYFIDPDGDPSTALRVLFDVPATGWSQWLGAAKFSDDATTCSASGCSGMPGHVAVSITTVENLVTDGCRDHSWADPPIGPGVEDLTAGLAALAPFQVTSAPQDVTAYGYRGQHLGWTVPELPMMEAGSGLGFTGCIDGKLKSWVAFVDTAEPGDAFYGYSGPGYVEELWVLDVEGTRLLIAAEQSAGSPPEDVVEQRAILDSIRIEP